MWRVSGPAMPLRLAIVMLNDVDDLTYEIIKPVHSLKIFTKADQFTAKIDQL